MSDTHVKQKKHPTVNFLPQPNYSFIFQIKSIQNTILISFRYSHFSYHNYDILINGKKYLLANIGNKVQR